MIVDYLINYYFNISTCLFYFLIISILYFFNNRKSFILIILLAIIYDLFISNILFLYLTIFYLLIYFISYLKEKFKDNYLGYLSVLVLSIFFINLVRYLILSIGISNISIKELGIIILENIISGILFSVIYFLIKNKE